MKVNDVKHLFGFLAQKAELVSLNALNEEFQTTIKQLTTKYDNIESMFAVEQRRASSLESDCAAQRDHFVSTRGFFSYFGVFPLLFTIFSVPFALEGYAGGTSEENEADRKAGASCEAAD